MEFQDSKKKGKLAEKLFIEYYFKWYGIDYEDVSEIAEWQRKQVDFLTPFGKIDVKNWSVYSCNHNCIAIEDMYSCNSDLYEVKKGWLYTSEADFVFYMPTKPVINPRIAILKLNYKFISFFEKQKHQFKRIKNKHTQDSRYNNTWQSSFYSCDIELLKKYCVTQELPNLKS